MSSARPRKQETDAVARRVNKDGERKLRRCEGQRDQRQSTQRTPSRRRAIKGSSKPVQQTGDRGEVRLCFLLFIKTEKIQHVCVLMGMIQWRGDVLECESEGRIPGAMNVSRQEESGWPQMGAQPVHLQSAGRQVCGHRCREVSRCGWQ